MHIIEQTFCQLEYDKFVLGQFENIPQDREDELQELIQEYGERSHRKQHYKRLALLKQERPTSSTSSNSYYANTYGVRGVRRYAPSNGDTVYRVPVLSFAMGKVRSHYTNCYLIVGKELTLIDCGTQSSEEHLNAGLRVVNEFYGENVKIEDIDHVIITHAHIDHFGGLSFLYPGCRPNIYAHEDDVGSIENIQEVLVQTRQTIAGFLHKAGLEPDLLRELLEMYTSGKRTMESFSVSHPVQDGDRIIDDYEIIHVPGHCPGHINIRVGDIAFLGDHILTEITPHQFPRFYMKGMGLVHYIPSLLKISSRSQKIRLGLGAHNEEVSDVRGRAMEIINEHHNRLADILSLMDQPKTLHELTTQYFTEIQGKPLSGYDRILALEEIQAHMEYLADAMNYVEVAHLEGDDPDVLRYRRI